MNFAFGKCRLAFLERAFVKAPMGVVHKGHAVGVWFIRVMILPTVQGYHCSNSVTFTLYSGAFISHIKQIIRQYVWQNKKATIIWVATVLFW